MNKFVLQYIYTWKYNKETLCVAIFTPKKQKCHYFLFFFYKIGEQKSRTGPAKGRCISERGKVVGKGYRRVNMVEMLCTHVCK
jgi:hypothetical protein